MIPARRLVVLAAVPVALALAWTLAPGVLPAIVATDVVLVVAAAIDLLRNRADVAVTRRVEAMQAVGRAFPVTLEVRGDPRRPLAVIVDDEVGLPTAHLPATAVLPAGGAVAVAYTATATQRGHHRLGDVTVRWRSPWGLWWRQARVAPAGDAEVRVYPDFTFLRDHALKARHDEQRVPVRTQRRPGGESEFQRLRPYAPGDPYRHIDWKATARRQAFVTREYGQESNQNVLFLLDAGRTMTRRLGELTAFDHGLNAALAMGSAALRHGDRVGLMAFDRTVRAWLPPRGGASSSTHLVHATYDVFPSLDEPDYAGAFRHLAAHVRRRSLVVLITSVQDQVNAEAATAVVRGLAGRHLPLCVWLRDPREDAVLDAPADDRAAWFRRAATAELARWRADTLAGWRDRGALVVDVEPDGLSSALLARYLEIKARRLL